MDRQVVPLEDLMEGFMEDLDHALEDVDPPGSGRPPN
jgi:hypothetical protein